MTRILLLALLLPAANLTPLPKVLSLSEAIKIGRSNQPQLRMAAGSQIAAHARANQARAPLLPQLIGSIDYERTTSNYVLRPGALPTSLVSNSNCSSSALTNSKATNTSYNYFTLQATLNQLVYDFNYSIDHYRQGEALASAQDANVRAVQILVDYNVRNAYFAAHAAQALVQVGQETLDNQRKHMEQTEGYIQVGTHAEIDLAQAKNDVATARVQLISAQNTYQTSKVALNQAMGVEAKLDYDVTAEGMNEVRNEAAEDDSLVDEALDNRPEFLQLSEQVRAQQLNVSSLGGQYWPSIGVQGNVSDVGLAVNSLVWNWNVQAILSWNIFQGGLTKGQVDEAQGTLQVLQGSQDMLRQQVRLDVETARLSVKAGKETLEAAGEALFNARERLRYAEGRYETGVGSAIELGDAQVAVTTAAAQVVQSEYQLASARAQLIKSVGRIE